MAQAEEGIPTWCPGDEWCPITATAAIVGRKWHPVIIHRLLEHGPLRFSELEERMDGVSGKVLSESLEDLEEKQLVERLVLDDRPVRVEYALTDYGEGLESVIKDMFEWGREYLVETDDREKSVV